MVRVLRRRAGISPVLATLILIVIAVVAGLMVYAWVSGWMGGWLGAGGKELKVIHIIFDKTTWTKHTVGKTAANGEVEYDLGFSWYYTDKGAMRIYVYASDDSEIELTISGDDVMHDTDDVGDISYYDPWKITIDYGKLQGSTGKTFDDKHDVKVTATWYRIRLFVKNTGGESLSIRRVWAGTTSDCPWDWSGRIKHISLPYRLNPGSEIWLHLTTDYDSGKKYFFKIECADGSVFGPFSKTAP